MRMKRNAMDKLEFDEEIAKIPKTSQTRSAHSVREGIKRQKLLSASADARSPGEGTTPGGWKSPRVGV